MCVNGTQTWGSRIGRRQVHTAHSHTHTRKLCRCYNSTIVLNKKFQFWYDTWQCHSHSLHNYNTIYINSYRMFTENTNFCLCFALCMSMHRLRCLCMRVLEIRLTQIQLDSIWMRFEWHCGNANAWHSDGSFAHLYNVTCSNSTIYIWVDVCATWMDTEINICRYATDDIHTHTNVHMICLVIWQIVLEVIRNIS